MAQSRRFTVPNHQAHPGQPVTYRIPARMIGEFRMLSIGDTIALFGDLANRLGEYESLGSVEEIRSRLEKIKK